MYWYRTLCYVSDSVYCYTMYFKNSRKLSMIVWIWYLNFSACQKQNRLNQTEILDYLTHILENDTNRGKHRKVSDHLLTMIRPLDMAIKINWWRAQSLLPLPKTAMTLTFPDKFRLTRGEHVRHPITSEQLEWNKPLTCKPKCRPCSECTTLTMSCPSDSPDPILVICLRRVLATTASHTYWWPFTGKYHQ